MNCGLQNSDVPEITCHERRFGKRGNKAGFLVKENQTGQLHVPHVAWKIQPPQCHEAQSLQHCTRSKSFPAPIPFSKSRPACSWPKRGARTNIRGGVNGRCLQKKTEHTGAAAAGLGNKIRRAVMTGSWGGLAHDRRDIAQPRTARRTSLRCAGYSLPRTSLVGRVRQTTQIY